jgi:hypothetical protein
LSPLLWRLAKTHVSFPFLFPSEQTRRGDGKPAFPRAVAFYFRARFGHFDFLGGGVPAVLSLLLLFVVVVRVLSSSSAVGERARSTTMMQNAARIFP